MQTTGEVPNGEDSPYTFNSISSADWHTALTRNEPNIAWQQISQFLENEKAQAQATAVSDIRLAPLRPIRPSV